jgi:phage-related tail fiber protein
LAIGKVYLTKRGRNLIAKGSAGAEIVFTRFAIGDGNLTGQAIEDLNELIHYRKTVTIGKIKPKETGILSVYGNFSNSESGGFYYRELGLFAIDPDLGEILYAYGNAGNMAEYIPLFQEELYEKTIILNVYHGNAEQVTAVMDESLVFATKEDVEELASELDYKADKNLGNVSAESFRAAFASSGLGGEVADKTTLDAVSTNVTDIKDKVGSTADTGGTTTAGSIFAKLNAILHQFLSYWTPARAQKLDASVSNEVWTDARAEKIDALSASVATLESRGCVKSVQSGIVGGGLVPDKYFKININTINPKKAMVILNESAIGTGSGNYFQGSYLVNLTASYLEITPNSSYLDTTAFKTGWQVIEFY